MSNSAERSLIRRSRSSSSGFTRGKRGKLSKLRDVESYSARTSTDTFAEPSECISSSGQVAVLPRLVSGNEIVLVDPQSHPRFFSPPPELTLRPHTSYSTVSSTSVRKENRSHSTTIIENPLRFLKQARFPSKRPSYNEINVPRTRSTSKKVDVILSKIPKQVLPLLGRSLSLRIAAPEHEHARYSLDIRPASTAGPIIVNSRSSSRRIESLAADQSSSQIAVLDLRIVTETDHADISGKDLIWTAIDAGAVLYPPAFPLSASAKGVDVAVLIDTSSLTSSNTLSRTREIVLALCRNLDVGRDRIALLNPQIEALDEPSGHPLSSPIQGRGDAAITLYPLQQVLMTELESIIERLRTDETTLVPIDLDFSAAMRSAETTLYSLESPHLREGSIKSIVIISPSAWNYDPLPRVKASNIHTINPSVAPMLTRPSLAKGWHLESGLCDQVHEQADGFFKSLLSYVRGGNDCGSLSDVEICLEGMNNTKAKIVIGDTVIPELRLGEIRPLLAIISVGQDPSGVVLSTTSESDSDPTAESLYYHLDAMLGQLQSTIVTAEASYKHSLLPQDTSLRVKKNKKLMRTVSDFDWTAPRTNSNLESEARVQRRLAYLLASNPDPRQALEAIDTFFEQPAAPAYQPHLNLLIQELNYRLLLNDRYQTTLDLNALEASVKEIAPPERISMHFSPPPSPSKHQMDTSDIISCNSSVTAIQEDSDNADSDAARRIWKEIRRNSKSKRSRSDSQMSEHPQKVKEEAEFLDLDARVLSERALRNRRSLGAETIHSMVQSGGSLRGSFSPFL